MRTMRIRSETLLLPCVGLLLGIARLTPPVRAQETRAPSAALEKSVAAIRLRCDLTDREAKNLQTVTRELPGGYAAGGDVTGYFAGPVLRKIVAHYDGESGRAVEEFYFDNKQLVFVLRTDWFYAVPDTADRPYKPVKIAKTEQNRFYFANRRLIRWLGPDKKARLLDSDKARQESAEIARTSDAFFALVRAQKPAS